MTRFTKKATRPRIPGPFSIRGAWSIVYLTERREIDAICTKITRTGNPYEATM
jgi:hypothetical protein